MQVAELLKLIDKERLYQTVLQLEGPRYPLDNMDALDAAAETIAQELTSYGLRVEMQEFKVMGMDETFKNVIGYLGDPSAPALVVGSHYDSVRNTPGANDNLSAVAISLEAARVLAQMDDPPAVTFAVFTLEEGHPFFARKIQTAFLEHGLYDSKYRFTSVRMLEFQKTYRKLNLKYYHQGKRGSEIVELVRKELEGKLSEDESLFLEIQGKTYKAIEEQTTLTTTPFGLIGSQYFVNNVVADGKKLRGAIVIDTVGWIKEEPYTQQVLPIPAEMLRLHKVQMENQVGNFIAVIGEMNSNELLDSFLSHCEDETVNLPYYGLDLPFGFPQIEANLPDVLRSDHAPFWEAGIPAIFITDTAGFRSELYHTPADISASMDFEVLLKLTQATVKTILGG